MLFATKQRLVLIKAASPRCLASCTPSGPAPPPQQVMSHFVDVNSSRCWRYYHCSSVPGVVVLLLLSAESCAARGGKVSEDVARVAAEVVFDSVSRMPGPVTAIECIGALFQSSWLRRSRLL